jgi:catenin alpha
MSLADMIDINMLLRALQIVQHDLEMLKNATNQDELTTCFKQYGRDLIELSNLAGKRQTFINDLKLRDELASARATLKNNTLKLFTSSKTLIRHPELSACQSNHEFVIKEIYEALDKIHGIVTNQITGDNIKHLYDAAASLAAALDDLDKQILSTNPGQFNEARMRLKLETQLENIISAVALMADSESTRPQRRDRIVNECNILRQGLQDILNAYISHSNRKGSSGVSTEQQIEHTTNEMIKMTKNLRKHLRKAVIDHVSDSFIETNLPLENFVEICKITSNSNDEKAITDCAQIFVDHAEKLLEVSSMACSMSNNLEGKKSN